jgi:hypothetical protein
MSSLAPRLESEPAFVSSLQACVLCAASSTNDSNSIEEVDAVYDFPAGALVAGADNVVTVVQDNMGLNEWSARACVLTASNVVGR